MTGVWKTLPTYLGGVIKTKELYGFWVREANRAVTSCLVPASVELFTDITKTCSIRTFMIGAFTWQEAVARQADQQALEAQKK
jgi:hypothetical protein